MTQNGTLSESCDPTNLTLCKALESEWPLERVVSTVVPVFFGIIGLIGLMGNALVIVGKCGFWRNQYALGRMETAAPSLFIKSTVANGNGHEITFIIHFFPIFMQTHTKNK